MNTTAANYLFYLNQLNLTSASKRSYSSRFTRFWNFVVLDPERIIKLESGEIEGLIASYAQHLQNQGLRASSINRYISTIACLFNSFASQQITVPRLQEPYTLTKTLKASEQKLLNRIRRQGSSLRQLCKLLHSGLIVKTDELCHRVGLRINYEKRQAHKKSCDPLLRQSSKQVEGARFLALHRCFLATLHSVLKVNHYPPAKTTLLSDRGNQ